MGFDMINAWRISNINEKYKWVCMGPCGLCFTAIVFAKTLFLMWQNIWT